MTAVHSTGAPGAPIGLVLRVALASAWAGLLVLVGLWLVIGWADRFPALAIYARPVGVTLVAMGEFVFAALVAGRLFPRAPAALRLGVEWASALTFLAGLAVLGGLAGLAGLGGPLGLGLGVPT